MSAPSFSGLSPLAHDAKAWPFEQARNLLARVLRVRDRRGERTDRRHGAERRGPSCRR